MTSTISPMHRYIGRVVDLLDPATNRLPDLDLYGARSIILGADPHAIRAINGSFAIVASEGSTVRMARSMDRPMRYFLAKRHEGPALFVADRIDTLHRALQAEGLANQFHPSYTRMVPAHYLVEIALVGCPDPDPTYTRFFTPKTNALPASTEEIGRLYVSRIAQAVERWLAHMDAASDRHEPIGVAFSGGIDSGAVFLVVYHTMLKLGLSPSRLKAFVLDLGDGPDVSQARAFLDALGLSLFLETIEVSMSELDFSETLRVIEDYKPLDVECAAMGLALCKGIRTRYPEWRHLADGDGGDENLKDYPIEENPELTIRSVIDNLMLYQEGWGVGRIKHSLTYSGGLSRSYVRTYAPARHYGFEGFSPYTQPDVMEVAEGIPFAALTAYDVPTLYSLKGAIVSQGVKALTGFDMPVFPKRRFQHGAVGPALYRELGGDERSYRRIFQSFYA
ncbi:MAG TPA: asparagine synthase-related protein [Terriglobia bacterium]|nr:asparagine synthase-related protein [Terriglobia bacterium]